MLRLDGGLFFATSDALEDRVRGVVHSTPPITGLVLDCIAIDFIDAQGSAKMRELVDLTEQAGVTLRLARPTPAVLDLLRRDHVIDRIGEDRVHDSIAQAVEAHAATTVSPDRHTR